MSLNAGTAVAYLTLDASQYTGGLNAAGAQMKTLLDETQFLDRRISALGGMLTSIGKTATVGITVPLLAVGTAMFNLSSDLNESINKVDMAFGESAKSVHNWSKNTLESFGIAKGSALDMAAGFGDMATSMEIPQNEAAEMSKSLVRLAGDMASFKNMRINEVETGLNGIFTGETESLKRLGIVMTETNLKAFALAKGFGENISALGEAEKVQLRYAYVMEKSKNSQGDFERTSGGAANQTRIFAESLKELGSSFGEHVLPVVTPIIASTNELVKKFASLPPEMQQAIVKTGMFVAAIGPLSIAIGSAVKGTSEIISLGARVVSIFDIQAKATNSLAKAEINEASAALSASVAKEKHLKAVVENKVGTINELSASVEITKAKHNEAIAYTNLTRAQQANAASSTSATETNEAEALSAYNTAVAATKEAESNLAVAKAQDVQATSALKLATFKEELVIANQQLTIAETEYSAVLSGTKNGDYVEAHANITAAKNSQALASSKVTTAELVEAGASKEVTVAKAIQTGATDINTGSNWQNVASIKAMKAAITDPLFIGIAAVGGIMAIVSAVNYLNGAYDRQKDKVDNLSDRYKTLTGELDTAKTNLKKNSERISEIRSQGALSYTNVAEIANLEAANKELEATLRLKANIFDETKKQLEVESAKASQMLSDKINNEIEEYNKCKIAIQEYTEANDHNRETDSARNVSYSYSIQNLKTLEENLRKLIDAQVDEINKLDLTNESDLKASESKRKSIELIFSTLGITDKATISNQNNTKSLDDNAKSTDNLTLTQKKLAENLKNYGASYKQAITGAQTLKSAQIELSKTGKLDSKSLEAIMDMYPEVTALAGDFGAIQDFVSQKISEQEQIARQSYGGIVLSNSAAFNAILNKSSTLPQALATYYGKDLSNFQNVSTGKYQADATVVAKLSELWAKYAGMSASSIGTQTNKLLLAGVQGRMTKEMQQELKDLMLYKEALNATKTSAEALSKEMSKPVSLGGGGSSNANSEAKEMNNVLQNQIDLLDHRKKMGKVNSQEELNQLEKIKIENTKSSSQLKLSSEEKKRIGEELLSLDERIFALKKSINEESYKTRLDKIGESDLGKQTDFSAVISSYKELNKEVKLEFDKGLVAENDYLERKKEITKLIEQSVNSRTEKLVDQLNLDTDETLKNIDVLIEKRKEMDGLENVDGTAFSFSSQDEIDLIYQKINANKQLIVSITSLFGEEHKYSDAQKSQLKSLESANKEFFNAINSLQIKAEKDVQKLTKDLTDLKSDYAKKSAETLEKYNASVSEINKKLNDDLKKANEDYIKSTEDINKKLLDSEKQLTQSYENELEQRKKSISNFTSIFSEISKKDVSGEQLLGNLKGQLDAIKTWQENLKQLKSKGVGGDLYQELLGLGPSAASEISALNNLTSESLEEYMRIYKEKQALADAEAQSQLQEQKQRLSEKISDLKQAADFELSTLSKTYGEKMSELTQKSEDELFKQKQAWEIATKEISDKFRLEQSEMQISLDKAMIGQKGTLQVAKEDHKSIEVEKTTTVKAQLKVQETEVRLSQNANISTLTSFVPVWRDIGVQYANMLLSGIQTTRTQISAYLDSIAYSAQVASRGAYSNIPYQYSSTNTLAMNASISPAAERSAVSALSTRLIAPTTQIDYEKLASVISANSNQSISYSPTYVSPTAMSVSEQRIADERQLRRLGFSF